MKDSRSRGRIVAAACALAAVGASAAPARAEEDERVQPLSWGVEPEPDVAADAPSLVGLWLPMDPGDAEHLDFPGWIDALGRHAAILPASGDATFVQAGGTISREVAAALAPEQATLRAGDRELPRVDARLGDFPQLMEGDVAGAPGKVTVGWTVAFASLEPDVAELDFEIPSTDPDVPPFRLRFFRWAERVAAIEGELDAWRVYALSDDMRVVSAIGPQLDCDAYRAFMARGDRFTVPFLIRELARATGRDPEAARAALPHWLVLHVLARTGWGRAHEVPAAGDHAAARRVVERWARARNPSLPHLEVLESGDGR